MQAISETDFNHIIENNKDQLIIIDMFADWCNPCKTLALILEKLEPKFPLVIFKKINIEENEDISNYYNITALPTLLFIKNKEVIHSFCGLVHMNQIEEVIKNNL